MLDAFQNGISGNFYCSTKDWWIVCYILTLRSSDSIQSGAEIWQGLFT